MPQLSFRRLGVPDRGDQGELFPGLKEDGEPVKVLDTREKAGVTLSCDRQGHFGRNGSPGTAELG